MDKDLITAQDIISAAKPRAVFGSVQTTDEAAKIYKRLASQFHPDKNSDPLAPQAMSALNVLYDKLVARLAPAFMLNLRTTRGTDLSVMYRRAVVFELGSTYLLNRRAFYVLQPEFADLADRFSAMFPIRFPDDKLRQEVAAYLPTKVERFALTTKEHAIAVPTPPGAIRLAEARPYVTDPKHVAWIISDLYGLACFFHITGITHAGISADSVFIMPQAHRTAIIGGWWYAAPSGQKLLAIPPSTAAALPPAWLAKPTAGTYVNCELIKALGRDLLGDPSGARLLALGVPKPMAAFLRSIGTGQTIIEYQNWKEVLRESFGPPKFQKLDLEAIDVY